MNGREISYLLFVQRIETVVGDQRSNFNWAWGLAMGKYIKHPLFSTSRVNQN